MLKKIYRKFSITFPLFKLSSKLYWHLETRNISTTGYYTSAKRMPKRKYFYMGRLKLVHVFLNMVIFIKVPTFFQYYIYLVFKEHLIIHLIANGKLHLIFAKKSALYGQSEVDFLYFSYKYTEDPVNSTPDVSYFLFFSGDSSGIVSRTSRPEKKHSIPGILCATYAKIFKKK